MIPDCNVAMWTQVIQPTQTVSHLHCPLHTSWAASAGANAHLQIVFVYASGWELRVCYQWASGEQ